MGIDQRAVDRFSAGIEGGRSPSRRLVSTSMAWSVGRFPRLDRAPAGLVRLPVSLMGCRAKFEH
jgi:hypothetical protein